MLEASKKHTQDLETKAQEQAQAEKRYEDLEKRFNQLSVRFDAANGELQESKSVRYALELENEQLKQEYKD